MIRVVLKPGRLEARYHGDPIVCAGVSALVISCVNFIKDKLQPNAKLDFNDKGGYVRLEYAAQCPKTKLVIQLLAFGLEQIKEEYPKQIKIKKR